MREFTMPSTGSLLSSPAPLFIADEMCHVWHTENLLHSNSNYKFGGGSALLNGNS
jgi:hypothetical protein